MPDAGVTCPASYTLDATTKAYYRVSGTGDGHFDHANGSCKADQTADITGYTHLVVLSDATELAEVQVIAAMHVTWVGLDDRTSPPTYQWITNEPAPTDLGWDTAAGEPNNATTQPCVRMKMNGLLETELCDPGGNVGFVCECDRYPDLR